MNTSNIDYADVQGTILRGYRVNLARHFILQITDAAAAKRFIGSMVDGSPGVPQITTAARWSAKPDYFLNIGFTCVGLGKLGLTSQELATFDPSFQLGATNATTAAKVFDVGESAPGNWIGGLSDGNAVHLVLSLWVTQDPAVLEDKSSVLRRLFGTGMKELSSHDARALNDNRVHFGYRDSIAQPTIAGAPPRKRPIPDDQPVVATGEFLLGYPGGYGQLNPPTQPTALCKNGSYSAFRILEQDVQGFEAFLTTYAKQAGIDPEMLAAKVCGRWRNGNPLELMPNQEGAALPLSQLNDFTYVSSDQSQDDTLGLKCPIGSHIRRNNPRNEAVLGAGNLSSTHHRITRRAMPYGPAYDPKVPDNTPRGLIGHFINGSIANQFEFLMAQWDNTSSFVMSAPGTNCSGGNANSNISGEDIFLGVNDPSSSSFTISTCSNGKATSTTIQGFGRLITTRGGAYCFLPSITGLQYLANLGEPVG